MLTFLAYRLTPWLVPLPGLLLAISLWFFRDPERSAGGDPSLVVAPADGRVMFVREVEEPRYLQGRAQVISIFLSLFDVHINRSPAAGEVEYKDHVPGRFVAAWAANVHEINERAYVGLNVRGQKLLVIQIAGLVARRIITWPKLGDQLTRGERIGLIRFGSCTHLYLPADASVSVKPGDRVKGGETIVGRLAR